MKKSITIILISIIPILASGQDRKLYQYHDNTPTKFGIQHYIELNTSSIVSMVENFIDDSLLSYKIRIDNLSEYHDYDSLEGGRFYPEDEIIITNELKFYDYELSLVPKWKQKEFNLNTRFVKGVLIHELVHLYIYQFIYECLENNIPINSEYTNFNIFPGLRSHYAPEFIEEGICEYVVMKLREGIFNNVKPFCNEGYNEEILKNFMQIMNTNEIRYQYSRSYVQGIFENNTFKEALLVILTSKPPSVEELLCPEQYYVRLAKQADILEIEDFRIYTENSPGK